MAEYAYSTYIDSEDYIKGLEGLYYSWAQTNSPNDFVILKTNEISNELLLPQINDKRIKIIEIPKYFIGYSHFLNEIENDINVIDDPFTCWSRQYTNTLGQFYAFNLTQYKAILNIHCDILIRENLDYLFEKYNKDKTFYVCNIKEKQLPFDTIYNKVFTIDCFFWLIKPDPDIFEKLSNNYALRTLASNANDIAEKFIYPMLDIKEILFEDSYNKIVHNTGPWKYWKVNKNFNPKDLLNKEEIEKIARTQYFYSDTKIISTKGQQMVNAYK